MGMIIVLTVVAIGVIFIAKNLDTLNSALKDLSDKEFD